MLTEAVEPAKAIAVGARWAGIAQKLPELCGDNNANVCGSALKVASMLAAKMDPKDFKDCGRNCINFAVPKWKEKKSSIKMNLDNLMTNLIEKQDIPFADMKQAIIEGMSDRQANLRLNAMDFVSKLAQNKELQPKILDDF